MVNTYPFIGPGTRWSVEDATAEDFMNVSRQNVDHVHEALNTIMDTDAADGIVTLGDDSPLQLGDGLDYWLIYDLAGTQLRLRSTDVDGGGADGDLFTVQDGTDDLVFPGDISATAFSGDGSALTGVGSSSATGLTLSGKAAENITKGQALYISGATGSNPQFSLADNSDAAKTHFIGIAAETKTTGQTILVRSAGELTGVDGSGGGESWADGQSLYLSTAGALTDIEPASGGIVLLVAQVVNNHAVTGVFDVGVQPDTHNVSAAAAQDLHLHMGDNAAATKTIFYDFAGNEVAILDSDGRFQPVALGTTGGTRKMRDFWSLGGWSAIVEGTDGDYTTVQAADDALDAGPYTMFVKQGTYTTLTISTDNVYVYVEPGTVFSGAVVLSGSNITLELGSGCDMQGLVTSSGAGNQLLMHNSCTLIGIVLSGASCLVDGGGWESIVNGGTANHAIAITGTGDFAIIRNIQAKTTAGGGQAFDAINIGTAADDVQIRDVHSPEADNNSLTTDGAGTHVSGCNFFGPDAHCIVLDGNSANINGNRMGTAGLNGVRVNSGGDDSNIDGNTILTTGDDGIFISGGGENCIVDSNRIKGWTNEAIDDDSGTSTIGDNETT